MSKTRRRTAQQPQQPQKAWMPRWPQLAILVGVILLVAAALILKNLTADPPAVAESKPQATAALPEAMVQTQATTELEQASSQVEATTRPDELPEAQLERLLTAGPPTVAFFHSNNCAQCIKMMEVVDQVYPEFDDSVALVDVNVYDNRNASLLQRARIQAIPTQIFFDQTGQGMVVIGAMAPDQFREQMQALAGGQ